MVKDPHVLLHLPRAYAYQWGQWDDHQKVPEFREPPGIVNALSQSLIRLLTEEEEEEFAHADEGVVIELKKDPFALKRYVWSTDCELRFPSCRPCNSEVDTKLFVSVGQCMPRVSIVFASLSITFDNQPDTDRLIAIIQSSLRDDGSFAGLTVESNGEKFSSCREFVQHCADHLGFVEHDSTAFWITEMRPGEAREGLVPGDRTSRKQIYGLMTADEGWAHVPDVRVHDLISQSWSSRNFLWVGAFGTGVLVYNNKSPNYPRDATAFFHDWFATERRYYTDTFRIAGLDHGVLYALEAAVVLKLTAESLIHDIEELVESQTHNGLTTVKVSWLEFAHPRVGSMQLRVFRYLDHARRIGIGELGSLDQLIANEVGLTATIQDVARYGEMIDTQSVNLTTIRLNVTVIVLTVVTVVIALIALFKP